MSEAVLSFLTEGSMCLSVQGGKILPLQEVHENYNHSQKVTILYLHLTYEGGIMAESPNVGDTGWELVSGTTGKRRLDEIVHPHDLGRFFYHPLTGTQMFCLSSWERIQGLRDTLKTFLLDGAVPQPVGDPNFLLHTYKVPPSFVGETEDQKTTLEQLREMLFEFEPDDVQMRYVELHLKNNAGTFGRILAEWAMLRELLGAVVLLLSHRGLGDQSGAQYHDDDPFMTSRTFRDDYAGQMLRRALSDPNSDIRTLVPEVVGYLELPLKARVKMNDLTPAIRHRLRRVSQDLLDSSPDFKQAIQSSEHLHYVALAVSELIHVSTAGAHTEGFQANPSVTAALHVLTRTVGAWASATGIDEEQASDLARLRDQLFTSWRASDTSERDSIALAKSLREIVEDGVL